MTTPAEAWAALTETVVAFYEGDREDMAVKRRLHDGVVAYVAARNGTASSPEKRAPVSVNSGAAHVVKFGRSKGKTLAECDTADLNWLAGAMRRSIDDPSKARFEEQNRNDLAAIEAELATR